MKHLQADLSTLFKTSIPTYRVPSLPSGPPYVRRFSIGIIESHLKVYKLQYTEVSMVYLDPTIPVRIQKPTPFSARHSFQQAHLNYHTFYNGWQFYTSRYFATSAEAYLQLVIEGNSEYVPKHIQKQLSSDYPEYFLCY